MEHTRSSRHHVPPVQRVWYKCPEEDGGMRMILYACVLTLVLSCHPAIPMGDEHSHRQAAETLLMVMEVDKSLPQMVEDVVEHQVQQNPQLAAQREVLQRFLTKYMHWDSV